ncbi:MULTISPECIES: restriction endonuclease subunit S [unclassified Streptomyces]|uniref:restriction endonuclease subunit S n=1 Tax=unclassified Streptomyces TaxID=2593676 RepID=UPI0035E235A5
MSDWKTYTIAELAAPGKNSLATGPFGSAISSRYFLDTGVPVIRGANLSLDVGTRLSDGEVVFISAEKANAFQRSMVAGGDLVFTCWGSIGQVGLISNRARYDRYIVSNKQMKLSLDKGLADPLFMYYAMSSPAMVSRVQGAAIGSSVPGFNLTQLRAITLSLPPLCEQQAIAEVLGALDDKIALNEQACAASLELADCYSQVANQGSNEGTVVTVAQLAAGGQLEFGDGYRTKRAEHGQPGLPILRVAEIADGEIHPAFSDYVSDEYRPAMGKKTSRSGDVVLTTKGTVGRVALISADHPEFVYSPQVCYFRPGAVSRLSSVYLFHWMRGPEFWRQAAGMKGQTDMADYLSLGDIKSLRITLLSEAALAEFTSKCAPLHAQAAAVRNENRTLADLRDTLLPQLLSGKLRVKDAVRTVEEVV